ncbi:hypothetical protein [Candidatus Mesenet endosymbiont of Agriotes lineatus]|uniref:hypothetical protein n=1 Tax=Candidatus Mesenet endosymbiont of Agriotes lineatus TaxID=3077948 RepID=UPI0030CD7A91
MNKRRKAIKLKEKMNRFVIIEEMWKKLAILLPKPRGRHGKNNRLFLEFGF